MSEARIPPQNIEAEKAVLGALLTDEKAFDTVSSIVKTEDFYRDAHRVIFSAISEINQSYKRADIILLVEALTRLNKLDAVGGIAYINALAGDSTAAFNVAHHAQIVSDKAQLRQLIDVGNRIVGMSYAGEEDTSDIVNKAEQLVLGVSGQIKGEESFTVIGEVLTETMERIHERQGAKDGITGIRSGFKFLDQVTRGLQKSDLIIVAARPSMGKTAFTLNIAQNVAVGAKKSVAFFSLEMPKTQLVGRVLASISGVDLKHLQSGQVQDSEWERIIHATQLMSGAPLYIDDTPGITIQEMHSKLRRLKVEHGLDLVVVDYIQLMQGRSGRGGENRQQEISEISRGLKLLAREFDVPVIALSQLSRSVESRTDKRPILSDLRESGSIEQDADIVAFLYRDKYYDEHSERGDITEVLIRKHRNGPLAKVDLMFEAERTRFRDVVYMEE